MKMDDRTEIPLVDIPDEITHTNQPEIETNTPHPVVPQPEALSMPAEPARRIGFQLPEQQ